MASPDVYVIVNLDSLVGDVVQQVVEAKFGVPMTLVPGIPQPIDLMSSYQRWLPFINQAMSRMSVIDLTGSMQDAVGYWFVNILGLCAPGALTSRHRFEPEDPAFGCLEPFVLKQIALRVLQSAVGGAPGVASCTFLEDGSRGSPSPEKKALRMVGPDASDEVQESILRYLEERDLGTVKICRLWRDHALHTIPLDLHPPKEAVWACFVAKLKAMEEGLTQLFAYVVLIELCLDWLGEDQIGGVSCGLAQTNLRDLDRSTGRFGVELLDTLDHLSPLRQQPLFFQSVVQFWGPLGVYDILLAIIGMMTVRQRYSYRNVLLRFQEDLRKEGILEHTVRVYDEFNRRQFHKAVSLGIEVNLEVFFAQINLEVFRDAKVYRSQFDKSLSGGPSRVFGFPNGPETVHAKPKTLVDVRGVFLRGKQKKKFRAAPFFRNKRWKQDVSGGFRFHGHLQGQWAS